MGEGPTPTARPLSTIPLFSLYCVFIPLKQTLDMQHVVHLNRNADSMSVEYPKKSEILSWALSLWRNMFYRIVILLFFTFLFRNPDMLIASFFHSHCCRTCSTPLLYDITFGKKRYKYAPIQPPLFASTNSVIDCASCLSKHSFFCWSTRYIFVRKNNPSKFQDCSCNFQMFKLPLPNPMAKPFVVKQLTWNDMNH